MAQSDDVVFIHGLGDSPQAWEPLVQALPAGYRGLTASIPGLDDDAAFTLEAAAGDVVGQLRARGIATAHLCGGSLGAMIALRVALDAPDRVRTLTLAAGQVRPPRSVMAVQGAMLRMIPRGRFAAGGVSKERLLAVAAAASRVDFSADLGRVTAPTLVLCGANDRLNLRASRRLAAEVPQAEMHVVPDAGHKVNVDQPQAFSRLLNDFLRRCEG